MCIAILNNSGFIAKQSIENSYANNYHGAGFAYSKGDSFHVYKTDKGAQAFYKAYKKHRNANPNVPFLLHFRISTHGTITTDNLHPFVVGDVAMIHNGMVDIKGHSRSDKRSDTRFLCEEILAHLPSGWHMSKGFQAMLDEMGGWSKFVFLGLDNSYSIVGESAGHWADGNWYSNTSYKQVNSYVDYGGKQISKSPSVGYSYGKSYDAWDDIYDSYPSTTKPKPIHNSVTVPIPLQELTLVESKLRSAGLIHPSHICYNASLDKDIVEDYKLLDSYVEATYDKKAVYNNGIEDTYVEPMTWYSIEDKPAKALWLELNGKEYTVVYHGNQYITHSVAPFAVRSNELMTALLKEFNYSPKDGYVSTNTRFSDALLNCGDLFDEAESYDWIKRTKKDDVVNNDYCDNCLESSPVVDMNDVDGWKLCDKCADIPKNASLDVF